MASRMGHCPAWIPDSLIDLSGDILGQCQKFDVHRPGVATSLMACLDRAFVYTGKLEYLDEKIAVGKQILRGWPSDRNPYRPLVHNLADALQQRFQLMDNPKDLQSAISLSSVCMSCLGATPHIGEVTYVHKAAELRVLRFRRYGEKADLDAAVAHCRRLIPILPPQRHDLEAPFEMIGQTLLLQFLQDRDVAHLQESIDITRSRLRYLPSLHPDRVPALIMLGGCYRELGNHLAQVDRLRDAVELHHEALSIVHSDDPNRAGYLHECAQDYISLWKLSAEEESFRLVMDTFREAAHSAHAPPHARLGVALAWCNLAKTSDLDGLSEAFQAALRLLPQTILFSGNLNARLEALRVAPGLARDAALYELSHAHVQLAVQQLEECRTLFWHRALKTRRSKHMQDNASGRRLAEVLRMIDMVPAGDERLVSRRQRLEREYQDFMRETEAEPDVRRALHPKTFDELSVAASAGPVVVLVANETSAAAVVVTCNSEPLHIPFPGVNLAVLDDLLEDLHTATERIRYERKRNRSCGSGPVRSVSTMLHCDTFEEGLERLWTIVVSPVLRGLDLQKTDFGERPRLWWCTTGPFSFLPLHAAGHHKEATGEWTSDYIVSSYTPTIDALLSARSTSTTLTKDSSMLLVAEPQCSDPEFPVAHSTLYEIACVQKILPSAISLGASGDGVTVQAVIDALPSASVLHLACHGVQDGADPLKSGFCMRDGVLDVARLMDMEVPGAAVAFLSACESAMGDRGLPDETLHLAAAMMFVGFRSVIGTMWSMDDTDGPKIAQCVYQAIAESIAAGEFDYGCIPRALDAAMRMMRDAGTPACNWATWIHMGM